MPAVNCGYKKNRTGILGCSDIARRRFIPALLKSDSASLNALASSQPDKARVVADNLNVDLMSYEELIRNPAIELIYISLPNYLHEQWAIKALEQGKHVICEKPLGLSAGSVARMIEAAERHEVLLYENLMYLNHPQHEAVRSLINEGRIGKVHTLDCVFTFPCPRHGDFRLNPHMGGGAFHDLNRYPLSAAAYFLKGKSHSFVDGHVEERDGLNYFMQASSVTDQGERFSFLIAFGRPYQSYYEISGETGIIRVDRAFTTPADMENRVMVKLENDEDASFDVPPCDHFLSTIEHVCELIRGGTWHMVHENSLNLAILAETMKNQCRQEVYKSDD